VTSSMAVTILCEAYAWESVEVHTVFWLDSRKGRDQLEYSYCSEIKWWLGQHAYTDENYKEN
jgi:hypothetical protein